MWEEKVMERKRDPEGVRLRERLGREVGEKVRDFVCERDSKGKG